MDSFPSFGGVRGGLLSLFQQGHCRAGGIKTIKTRPPGKAAPTIHFFHHGALAYGWGLDDLKPACLARLPGKAATNA